MPDYYKSNPTIKVIRLEEKVSRTLSLEELDRGDFDPDFDPISQGYLGVLSKIRHSYLPDIA
ncbi:hypothetical protein J4466_00375 [Candidatus Pacearchaeota archaeon]|nr:hypothetical protein [Candidatus Pacearchaeota archaeon]